MKDYFCLFDCFVSFLLPFPCFQTHQKLKVKWCGVSIIKNKFRVPHNINLTSWIDDHVPKLVVKQTIAIEAFQLVNQNCLEQGIQWTTFPLKYYSSNSFVGLENHEKVRFHLHIFECKSNSVRAEFYLSKVLSGQWARSMFSYEHRFLGQSHLLGHLIQLQVPYKCKYWMNLRRKE